MIKVRDLKKSYSGREILKGLSLDVNEGETVVILGRSGVGKSVLLKQIIGIEQPDSGSVDIENVRVTDLNQSERYKASKSMGMLFQGAALFDSMNVAENVAFYLRQHENLKENVIKDRVSEALNMVGLENMENTMPSNLSGGQKKRVALARLIVYKPRIILYDEPTTGLDPITAMQINQLINQTQKELNATSIVVTHDIRSAMEVGDRIAFHHDGKIAQIAPKEEFQKIDDPQLRLFFENAVLTQEYLSHQQQKRP